MSRHQRSLSTRFAALLARRPARPLAIRLALAAGGVALLAASAGTAFAVTRGHHDTPTIPMAQSRQDDRASRGEQRPLTTPSTTPSATAAAKATGAPKTATPKRTTTSRPTTSIAIPASCKAYSGNRAVACALLPQYGFSISQMPALDKLWQKESGWRTSAANTSSGAYGIPQALPGSKMATIAGDWRTNPATQIKWGLSYIKGRYGSPVNAWAFWQSHNWY